MLFLNTIVQGQIFELLIAITLSSYFIVIAYSFFKYRLNSKEEELKWLTKDFSFFGKNVQDIIKDELNREFPKRDYIIPIIFLTLLSFTCMVILFVPWLVYDFEGPNKESINPLLLGHEFWGG